MGRTDTGSESYLFSTEIDGKMYRLNIYDYLDYSDMNGYTSLHIQVFDENVKDWIEAVDISIDTQLFMYEETIKYLYMSSQERCSEC